MCEYETRVGSYADLLDSPARDRCDDGSTLVHAGDLSPTCTDCGRGTLQWAEAGYVPWHRICDACGSHWDLHPVVLFVEWGPDGWTLWDEVPVPAMSRKVAVMLAEGRVRRNREVWTVIGDHDTYSVRRTRRGWMCTCPNDMECSHIAAVQLWEHGVAHRARVRSMVTWEHVHAAIVRTQPGGPEAGGVPHVDGCWARRARFYRRR